MRHFNIPELDSLLGAELQEKIDQLSKPKGSLGLLERTARQVGMIQASLTPQLRAPRNIIFCADHGVVSEGISQSPKDVTWQVVINMLSGGAGVCYLCRQHGFALEIIDVGVDKDLSHLEGLRTQKIRPSTRNYLHEPAMTPQELERAIEIGAEAVDRAIDEGANILSFGEMGITNTSASALWMHLLCDIPLELCVGRGSGLDDEGLRHKYDVLQQVCTRLQQSYGRKLTALEVMQETGGYEMVCAVGAMLRCAERRVVVLVDGFIMTACLLLARALYPAVQSYAIFGHQGDEAGHALLLRHMGAEPLLQLGMRLGEGSGAVCAYPIVDSAVRMLSEMASFSSAKVTKYF